MTSKNAKIKVIELIADSEIGGGPSHVLGILSNIDKEKFDCYLICPSGYLSSEAKKIKGVEVINLKMASKFDLKSIFRLKQEVERIESEKNPFDSVILHAHGPRAAFYSNLVKPELAKFVYTEHLYNTNYRLGNPFNGFIQKIVLARVYSKANTIIVVSKSVKNFLIQRNNRLSGKIKLIPNGIEFEKMPIKLKPINESNLSLQIGTIGNLNEQKGQKYLIEAMTEIAKKYPLSTLEIIGDGMLRQDLEGRRRKLGLDKNISFVGRQKDIMKYMKHWDIFISPSISETFGIAILEAMKAGVPVIASDIDGISDIIENKRNGLLISPKEPAEIAKAAVYLLEHPVIAAKLRKNALTRAHDFDWKKIIKLLEEVYNEINLS